MSLILASQSPRRKEILKEMGYEFYVIPSKSKEVFNKKLPLDEALEDVAYQKAKDVQKKHDQSIILSADTIVVMDGKVLGKPKDLEQAKEFLKSYSNSYHLVKTAVCILTPTKEYSFVETTKVFFKKLSKKQIDEYVNKGTCLDKAGAYGIQECEFVDHIEGSYTNVVGLPSEKVEEVLKRLVK